MAGKVILNATGGELVGTCYRFDSRMLCILGRADNCTIQFHGTAAEGVSRHHCLLDLDPPHAHVQDLGSRNGTFLNDKNIASATGTDGKPVPYELKDGDSLRIVDNVFRVSIEKLHRCSLCGKELNDRAMPDDTGRYFCDDCLHSTFKTQPQVYPFSKTLRVKTCVVCGTSITLPPDSDDLLDSEFICANCRLKNPDKNATFRIPPKNELPSNLFNIPGYRILKRIGRGGMGDVYLGQDCDTLEKVAVKVLRPDIAFFESCRDDFLREAKNLMPLKHPNIVELKACRGDAGSVYLVLEYCSLGTIRNYIRERGMVLDIRTALDLTCQILDALDYAHNIRLTQKSILDGSEYTTNGLVHRDIKPENIFLSKNDGVLTAKISDFGLSKAFEMAGISDCTRTGDFSGTMGFISKQQFLNYKYVRPEVDVWAAAAVFFYMLTGLPPREANGDNPAAIFERRPLRIHEVMPAFPAPLAKVLDDELNDMERLKYKTATAFRYALLDASRHSDLPGF